MNILFTWLGNRDLKNMEVDEHAAISGIACFSSCEFDRIVILSNQKIDKWTDFERWIKLKLKDANRKIADVQVHHAKIVDPIDYVSIAEVTQEWFSELSLNDNQIVVNLTSGTGAMTAVSTMVGTAYENCRFSQSTPENEIKEVNIPSGFTKKVYDKSAVTHTATRAASEPPLIPAFESIPKLSKNMKELVSKAIRLANADVPTLILGETGTGKETIAQAIHLGSIRKDSDIIAVNCGALAENLIESLLFGHKKGAFTGANDNAKGLFEEANGGTLFLDEVGELSASAQVKLLRVLQEKKINRVGESKTINVDVRIISATHRDLFEMVANGEFREDLYYRIAVGVLDIPPLRERIEDIEQLSTELSEQINKQAIKQTGYIGKKISDSGINFIQTQPWPGNIRELWNTLNRAFLWTDNKIVTEIELADAMISRQPLESSNEIILSIKDELDVNEVVDKFKKKYVSAALKASGGNKSKAADMLHLKDHQTVSNWMKPYKNKESKKE